MKSLRTRFQSLPRSMRWLVWLFAFVAVYFGIIEPTLTATADARSRADGLAIDLQQEQALNSSDSEEGRILANGRRSFGEPFLPENAANRPESLYNLVGKVLKDHAVENSTISERKIRMRNDEAASLLGPLSAGNTVERLILDVTFDASPETVTAILSELELAKEVAAVSQIELRRQDAGRTGSAAPSASSPRIVRATISPESWLVTRTAGGSLR